MPQVNWNIKDDLIKGDNLLFYLVEPSNTGMTVYDAITGNSTVKILAYGTSANIQIDADSIDASSKFSCKWGSSLAGHASYTIQADALYCNAANAEANSAVTFDTLMDKMVDAETNGVVGWVIGEESGVTSSTDCVNNPHTLDTSKPFYYGQAVITSLSLSAGNNEVASCSISLAGDGPIARGPKS